MSVNISQVTEVAEQNACLDGQFSRSHFHDKDFNIVCAEVIREIMAYSNNCFIIDNGGASGDMFGMLSELTGSNKLVVVDIDSSKLELGRQLYPNVSFVQAGLMHQLPIARNMPCILTQRALAQYFVYSGFDIANPPSLPIEGYTPEQLALFQYYTTFPTGTKIIDIQSSGDDRTGLLRFSYILNQVANGKQLNYLTLDNLNSLLDNINYASNRVQLRAADQFWLDETNNNPNFGYRNISNLYERYGNGQEFDTFKHSVLEAYKQSCYLYPGNTQVIQEIVDEDYGGQDLGINLRYLVTVLEVE